MDSLIGQCPKCGGSLRADHICIDEVIKDLGSLTFRTFAKENLSRALRWHPGGLESWSLSDWSVALSGEVGEYCNVVKKLNRVRDGLQQNAVDTSALKHMLADEIGDIGAYLDLCAQAAGLSLEECIRNKFNKISERENFPEKL